MPKRKFDYTAIADDYVSGIPIEEIKKKHSATTGALAHIVNSMKLPKRGKGSVKKYDHEKIVAEYLSGETVRMLQKKYPPGVLYAVLKKFGIPLRSKTKEENILTNVKICNINNISPKISELSIQLKNLTSLLKRCAEQGYIENKK